MVNKFRLSIGIAAIFSTFSMSVFATDYVPLASSLTQDQKREKVAEVLRSGAPLTMYNFVSKQKETIPDPMVLSKEKAIEFLPPIDEVREIFELYAQDHPSYAALIKTYTDLQQMVSPLPDQAAGAPEAPATPVASSNASVVR